jgi:hypothetical protein
MFDLVVTLAVEERVALTRLAKQRNCSSEELAAEVLRRALISVGALVPGQTHPRSKPTKAE